MAESGAKPPRCMPPSRMRIYDFALGGITAGRGYGAKGARDRPRAGRERGGRDAGRADHYLAHWGRAFPAKAQTYARKSTRRRGCVRVGDGGACAAFWRAVPWRHRVAIDGGRRSAERGRYPETALPEAAHPLQSARCCPSLWQWFEPPASPPRGPLRCPTRL